MTEVLLVRVCYHGTIPVHYGLGAPVGLPIAQVRHKCHCMYTVCCIENMFTSFTFQRNCGIDISGLICNGQQCQSPVAMLCIAHNQCHVTSDGSKTARKSQITYQFCWNHRHCSTIFGSPVGACRWQLWRKGIVIKTHYIRKIKLGFIRHQQLKVGH